MTDLGPLTPPDAPAEREMYSRTMEVDLRYFTQALVTEAQRGVITRRTLGGFVIGVGGVTRERTPVTARPKYVSRAESFLRGFHGLHLVTPLLQEIPHWLDHDWERRSRETLDAVRFTHPRLEPFEDSEHPLADYAAALDALRTRPPRAYIDPQFVIDS